MRGVTMLEMMTAAAIVVVLSGLAAASYQTVLRNSRSASEARRMLVNLQYARSAAVASGRCTGVLIGGRTAPPLAAGSDLASRDVIYQHQLTAVAGNPCGAFAMGYRVLAMEVQGTDVTSSGAGALMRASHFVWDVVEMNPAQRFDMVFHPDDGKPEVFLDAAPVMPGGVPPRFRLVYRDTLADPFANNASRRQLELSPTGTVLITPNYP